MPLHMYVCRKCGQRDEAWTSIESVPPALFCSICDNGPMARDYSSIAIAAVPQSRFSPSLGREISDQQQVTEAMKHITAESERKLGYTPSLVAMNPRDVPPAGASRNDPTSQALENAQKAAHDSAVQRGEPRPIGV